MLNRDTELMKAFNRAARPDDPPEPAHMTLVDAILAERPDLRDLPVEIPREGGVSNTVIIGDEVFKGPKAIVSTGHHERECDVLQQLGGRGLPVPEVTYVGRERVFFGMTRMPGVTVRKASLRDDEKFQLGKDVEDVLIEVAKACPDEGGEKFLTNSDLNEGNILVDPETHRLTALIDFGITDYVRGDELYRRGNDPFAEGTRAELQARKGELPKPHKVKTAAVSAPKAP